MDLEAAVLGSHCLTVHLLTPHVVLSSVQSRLPQQTLCKAMHFSFFVENICGLGRLGIHPSPPSSVSLGADRKIRKAGGEGGEGAKETKQIKINLKEARMLRG